jgi:hypothetical protein
MIQLADSDMLVAVSGYLDDEEVYRFSVVSLPSSDLRYHKEEIDEGADHRNQIVEGSNECG